MSGEKDEIREVLAQYCTFGDHGRFAELAALFEEDGSWEGRMGQAQGRTAIEALMVRTNPPAGQGPVRRHLVTNTVIVLGDGIATAQSTFMLIRESENGPSIGAVGHWDDSFAKHGSKWLLRSRKVTPEIIGEARLKS
jgi:SnoaL-like domain